MSAPLPTHITIGCHQYTVSDSQAAYQAMGRRHKSTKGALGVTDSRVLEIVLAPDQSASNKRDTLWHEVKHCAWRYLDWETPKNMMEEEIVCRATAPELDALRRNPDLVAYLLEPDDD